MARIKKLRSDDIPARSTNTVVRLSPTKTPGSKAWVDTLYVTGASILGLSEADAKANMYWNTQELFSFADPKFESSLQNFSFTLLDTPLGSIHETASISLAVKKSWHELEEVSWVVTAPRTWDGRAEQMDLLDGGCLKLDVLSRSILVAVFTNGIEIGKVVVNAASAIRMGYTIVGCLGSKCTLSFVSAE